MHKSLPGRCSIVENADTLVVSLCDVGPSDATISPEARVSLGGKLWADISLEQNIKTGSYFLRDTIYPAENIRMICIRSSFKMKNEGSIDKYTRSMGARYT